jgi:hypothetical protein
MVVADETVQIVTFEVGTEHMGSDQLDHRDRPAAQDHATPTDAGVH